MTGLTPEEAAASAAAESHARAGRVMPVVWKAPPASKPPRHWADLKASERVDAVLAAGLPKFRAAQIDRHFFRSNSDDPTSWTDLPTAVRTDIARDFFPQLITPIRVQTADAGTTVINVATEGAGDIQRQTGEINTLGAMVWNGTMWVVNGTYAHKYFVDTRTGDRLKSYTAHDSAVSGAPDAGTLAAACAIAGSGFAATGYGNLF